ncbi:ABC transporter ATP-binding protein [Verrucomicrobiota bacterium sgz303538]
MISLRHVFRRYPNSGVALDDACLEIAEHDFLAITGPSGCGKSTLLHLLGGMDSPTSGEIYIGDLALHRATESELTEYRRRDLGVVFQFFNLLPTMTVLENVCLPLLLHGQPLPTVRERARELISLVGLENRANHGVHQLSGGQMQRTAIARALIHGPKLLLADEPTGNLDSVHAAQVLELFQRIASLRQTTLVVVTHSEEVASAASGRIHMRDGKILSEP